jgi:HupE / UreJ protein
MVIRKGERASATPFCPDRARLMLARFGIAFAALVLFTLGMWSTPVLAHDIPAGMRAHAFVKVEGERLHVLVRLPLALLLNLDLPKKGPGYIDLAQVEPGIVRAIAAADKGIDLSENGQRLTLARGEGRISLPSDRSFDNFEGARTLLRGPKLPDATFVFWNQGYFDAYLEYAIKSAKSSFALDFKVAPGLGDGLKIDVRYLTPDGAVRAFDLSAGAAVIALDPHWYQAAWTFTKSGFAHIQGGADHLLFLVCLILPFRKIDWKLAGVITAFTVGHSITLIAAAYHVVPAGAWFAPLIELLIAASILYMAIENVVQPKLARRWLLSGLFGLVHGFGFSFMLQEQLQFAGSHLLLSLLAFNVGIELGQLLVLVVALPLLVFLYRRRLAAERAITAIICLLVGHTAWHWMGERVEALRRADWPLDSEMLIQSPALIAGSVVLVGGLAWLVARYRKGGPAARAKSPGKQQTNGVV